MNSRSQIARTARQWKAGAKRDKSSVPRKTFHEILMEVVRTHESEYLNPINGGF